MNASNENNNNNNDDQQRKGKGRQKIQMAKIENETHLQVTFSKRRAGIFKKASELSTLCGAESVVLIFSPGDKPHTYGHPDFDTVSNRFLDANNMNIVVDETPPQPTTAADQLIAAHSEAAMQQRVQELVTTGVELEQEKRRKREIEQLNKANPQQPPIEELDRSQLDQMKQAIMSFQQAYGDVSKTEADQNASFNANVNNVGIESSCWSNVNHDVAAGSSSWNNNVASSMTWNTNVHDHVGGTSSWSNVNDLSANSTWGSLANGVAGNDVAAENSWNWDQNIANANTQPQGLGFHQNSFYDYGGPSMIPTIPNVPPPYPYPAVGGSSLDNFGFTVQYVPPVNHTHAFVVPYEIGQPAANPNAFHDLNGGQFHRNNRRSS